MALEHKYLNDKTRATVSLPDTYLTIIRNPHALLLEKNYSEVDALLVEGKGKLRFRVSSLYLDLVHENVLPLIGEHPENSCEALSRPAELEGELAQLLNAEKFTRSSAGQTFQGLLMDGQVSPSIKDSDSRSTSTWSTADISTDGSPPRPEAGGRPSAPEEKADDRNSLPQKKEEPDDDEPQSQHQGLQELPKPEDIVDESMLKLPE